VGWHSARTRNRLLSKALEQYFAQYFSRNPVNATFTGLHALDDQLPDWSVAGRTREAAEMRRLREALNDTANPSVAKLKSSTLALDAELARANLDVRLAEHDSAFFHARNPALWTGEAIFSVVSLMIRDFAPLHERLRSLIARLNAIPRFLAAMPEAITSPVPAQWMARAARECAVADGLFEHGLHDWMEANAVEQATTDLVHEAAERARDAFTVTAASLAALPSSGTGYAVGADTFDVLLRRGHFCRTDARTLLDRALSELPVEQQKLDAIVAASAHGSWPAVQAALADDHPTIDDYYATFQGRWDDCHRIATAHNAVTWQPWPIRYVPIPAWAQPYAPQLYWLFYRSPAPFDPYDVYEYVVTPINESMTVEEQETKLRAWNHSTIALNHVVHHGAVGHHVQNWHARHRATSRIGRIAATDCASRIAMFLGGSMAEGWACYATQLMDELGMLTPLEQISEQHTRVRMLARAIVDIRLHHGMITFEQAVQYYQDVVGMPLEVATAETTKNSMFPCTALMYWLGTTGILALRARVKAERGTGFSLREFHDELLSRGAVPVLLVTTLMSEPVMTEPVW
jgi:uncharacterized protein (DUF885 family)